MYSLTKSVPVWQQRFSSGPCGNAAVLSDLAPWLHRFFTSLADSVASSSGFIKRQRVFSGSSFLQTCVFGWLDFPDATLEQLVVTAASLGLNISCQGLDQRFSPAASDFLRLMLAHSVRHCCLASPRVLPLLDRFPAVYLDDCSSIALPHQLNSFLPGCGGSGAQADNAALKILLRWELRSSAIAALIPASGKTSDLNLAEQLPMPARGSLRLADLGFFKLDTLYEYHMAGVCWISKFKIKTTLRYKNKRIENLAKWLDEQTEKLADKAGAIIDNGVVIGGGKGKKRIKCRLIAWRLSPTQAEKKREQLKKDAAAKSYKVSEQALQLCGWVVLVTNVSERVLSGQEVLEVYRVRWQIELIFKSFKSDIKVNEWRSRKPWRVLCEVYAKLIAAVVQSQMTMVCWSEGPQKSMRRLLSATAGLMAKVLWQLVSVSQEAMVQTIQRALPGLARVGKMASRKKNPGTFQRLKQARDQTLEQQNNARSSLSPPAPPSSPDLDS